MRCQVGQGGHAATSRPRLCPTGFSSPSGSPPPPPFWQANHTWTEIIKAGSISANFSTITGTNGWTAGTFTTTVTGTGVNLVYTSHYVTPTPGTSMGSVSVNGGNVTINYTPTAGNRWVLLSSPVVDAPLSSWSRVKTNFVGATSFTVTGGAGAKTFYCIQSE